MWLKHPRSLGCGCRCWGYRQRLGVHGRPRHSSPAPTQHPPPIRWAFLSLTYSFFPLFPVISFRRIRQRCHGNAAATPAGCACLDAAPQEPAASNLLHGLDMAPGRAAPLGVRSLIALIPRTPRRRQHPYGWVSSQPWHPRFMVLAPSIPGGFCKRRAGKCSLKVVNGYNNNNDNKKSPKCSPRVAKCPLHKAD